MIKRFIFLFCFSTYKHKHTVATTAEHWHVHIVYYSHNGSKSILIFCLCRFFWKWLKITESTLKYPQVRSEIGRWRHLYDILWERQSDVCVCVCVCVCSDGTLPVQRRRRTHAFGGGDHQSCLRPLTEDDNNECNESDGDAGKHHNQFLCYKQTTNTNKLSRKFPPITNKHADCLSHFK